MPRCHLQRRATLGALLASAAALLGPASLIGSAMVAPLPALAQAARPVPIPAQTLRGVVEDALPELVPAVVQWNVLVSEHPFVLGLSPLLRIDTYLESQPPPRPVRLDATRLGRGDLIHTPVALLPEQAGPLPPPDSEGDRA